MTNSILRTMNGTKEKIIFINPLKAYKTNLLVIYKKEEGKNGQTCCLFES